MKHYLDCITISKVLVEVYIVIAAKLSKRLLLWYFLCIFHRSLVFPLLCVFQLTHSVFSYKLHGQTHQQPII